MAHRRRTDGPAEAGRSHSQCNYSMVTQLRQFASRPRTIDFVWKLLPKCHQAPLARRMALVHHANCRTLPAGISRWSCQILIGMSGNVAAGTHLKPQTEPRWSTQYLRKALQAIAAGTARASHCEAYCVISMEIRGREHEHPRKKQLNHSRDHTNRHCAGMFGPS